MMTVGTKVLLWLVVGGLVAVAMDGWSAFLHGRVWHRRLWFVHRSHHEPHAGRFELNDVLSVTHAPIAIVLILYGCLATPGWPREVAFGVGLGMTAFGVAYVVVHDGLVHGRLPVAWLARWRYFRQVRNAHHLHHRTSGAPYGLFFGPWVVRRLGRAAADRRQRS